MGQCADKSLTSSNVSCLEHVQFRLNTLNPETVVHAVAEGEAAKAVVLQCSLDFVAQHVTWLPEP